MKNFLFACALLLSLAPQAASAEGGGFSKIFSGLGKPKPAEMRNNQPLEEMTSLYQQKEFPAAAKDRKPLAYFWFQPAPPYPDGLKFPLVVVLHGAPGKAYAGKFLIAPEMQMKYPAFILAPALPASSTWATPAPITLADGRALGGGSPYEALPDVVALIKNLQTQYPIDSKRIYVMGCSEGGVGTFGAVLRYPGIFAAAVPMAGAWNPEDAPQMTKVPLWAFHGAKDDVMPAYLSKDIATLIHQYGGTAYYTEFPEMNHQCPAAQLYSPQMWEWLFRQTQ